MRAAQDPGAGDGAPVDAHRGSRLRQRLRRAKLSHEGRRESRRAKKVAGAGAPVDAHRGSRLRQRLRRAKLSHERTRDSRRV
jgi:hypothetical protein